MKKTILFVVAAALSIAGCGRREPDDATAVANDIAAEGDFNGGSVLTRDQDNGDVTTVPASEAADDANAAADQDNEPSVANTAG